MTDELKKAVDRIHKLLALANDGGATEAEANLAMTKAQELMAEHNLTMASLEAKGGKGEARVKQAENANLMYAWKRELLEKIAAVNFCYIYVFQKKTAQGQRIGGGYEIIGRESNVVATRNMFSYLLQTIERLVVDEVGTNMHDRYTKAMHSFRLGLSDRLKDRLQERHDDMLERQAREAREAEARNRHPGAVTGNALVVVMKDFKQQEDDLNNDMVNGWEPGTTAKRRAEYEARRAAAVAKFEAKQAEGRALGLNDDEAYYYAQGISVERARELAAPKPVKQETERQRQKRQEREERENERWRERQWRQQSKVDWHSYNKGQRLADDVRFEEQVDEKRGTRIGRK